MVHVEQSLLRMQRNSPAPQMGWCDIHAAMNHITTRMIAHRAWIVDGYLVMFDIGAPWHSNARYLIEELILKIQVTDRPVTVAIDALSEFARRHNCTAVVAGDTQIGYMAPKYLAAGFVTLGTQHFKEIT